MRWSRDKWTYQSFIKQSSTCFSFYSFQLACQAKNLLLIMESSVKKLRYCPRNSWMQQYMNIHELWRIWHYKRRERKWRNFICLTLFCLTIFLQLDAPSDEKIAQSKNKQFKKKKTIKETDSQEKKTKKLVLHRNYFIEAGHYRDILLVDRELCQVFQDLR